uniref:protein THYLAKOID ASSEMBLY 8, chloroplastic n=1 Tax=Erigeron canadensis TaxID=72917 RepID=UPI001CB8E792|nr:protein THYLAKOID ASSEMBLY 8, chloroplastic [Erigeron canadensis]
MANSLHFNVPFHQPHHTLTTKNQLNKNIKNNNPVRCGPRDNRGPLYKGRTLSIEAIQAVQSLKRSNRLQNNNNNQNDTVLNRLVKSDLFAVFNELIRQDQFDLAVKVFKVIRCEDWYKTDLNLYAKLVTAMANKGMKDQIDHLLSDIQVEDVKSAEGKGLVTVIKALLAADMAESTVRIYEMMKSSGWTCDSSTDEYVGKVLSRGLKRLGKKKVADEIDREIDRVSGGVLEKIGI